MFQRSLCTLLAAAAASALGRGAAALHSAPVLVGPFSGSWFSVSGNLTASGPGTMHLGRYGAATVQLGEPISTPNTDYGLRLDVRRDGNWTGYGWSLQATAEIGGSSVKLWYVEILKDATAAYHTLNGKWQGLGTASTAAWPADTTFRVEVFNQPGASNLTVTAMPTNGSSPTVLLATGTVEHDGDASVGSGNLTVTATDQTAAFVDQVFVTQPLVPPLQRVNATQPNAKKAAGGTLLEAFTAQDGRVFLRSAGTAQFAGVVTLSAEEADAARLSTQGVEVALLATDLETPTSFSQRYAVGNATSHAHATLQWSMSNIDPACGSAANCSILQDLSVVVSMETVATHDRNRTFRLTLRYEPTAAGYEPQNLLSFRQRYDSVRGTLPQTSSVDNLHPVAKAVYGTERLSLLGSELGGKATSIDPSTGVAVRGSYVLQAYLPIVSVHGRAISEGSSGSGGYSIFGDPRASWSFHYGVSGLAASRLFFLGRQAGAIDSGYHNGDVETNYTLRFAMPVSADGVSAEANWARLFAMYRRLNPWMAAGPQLPPGVFISGLPTQETLPRFQKLHANILGLMNLFFPENQTNLTCNGCHAGDTPAAAVARDAEIGLHLWTNIRMASNTSNVVAEDPLMDFRLFNDSLQRGSKGEILPCWE